MTNPVAREWKVSYQDDTIRTSILTFCPACQRPHPFTIDNGGGDGNQAPVWNWDGNLESPTFSPSMLVYSTVRICDEGHVLVPCDDHENCDHNGHRITNYYKTRDESQWEYAYETKLHEGECQWGNCHSFLRNGVWQFLGDCAHDMAGQNVPMVPLPDYLMNHGF